LPSCFDNKIDFLERVEKEFDALAKDWRILNDGSWYARRIDQLDKILEFHGVFEKCAKAYGDG